MITHSDTTGKKIFNDFIKARGKAKNIEFTQDEKDRIDVIVDNSTVELKYRKNYNFNSPIIQNGGILLEKDKVEYALRTIKESGYTHSYYCSIFADNVITFIDFAKVNKELKPIKKELPITSEFGNSNTRYKEVYFVPITLCQTFNLVK